jgi:FKBP-type peptidyl-prolyl cis-trans isomerase FkpA
MTGFGSIARRFPIALAVAAMAWPAASCSNPFSPSQNVHVPFSVTDVVVGTGPEAVPGSVLIVDYAGYLYDAKKENNEGLLIDSSLVGQPYTFILGIGQVLPGWDQGLVGMKLGGFRRLVIPPELAYGPFEHYPVPKNATLVFDINLLGIQTPDAASTTSLAQSAGR